MDMKQINKYFLLIAVVLTGLFGCSDDKDSAPVELYGYAQFKICKRASYEADKVNITRASDGLDKLADAHKIKVVMSHEGSTIAQTLVLQSYSSDNAEFGLTSEKLELLTGDYTIIGYYIYDKLDTELLSGTIDDNTFTVVAGGLTVKEVPVDVSPRGMASFRLVKEFFATRAGEYADYPFENIKLVDIVVQNTFTQEKTTVAKVAVETTEDFRDGTADEQLYPGKNAETTYGVCDTIVWLKAGTYKICGYTTYSDKKGKSILEVSTVVDDETFTIEDNVETKEVEVPIYLSETAEYIKDYIALKEIWEAMDGANWSYSGEDEVEGCNWNFNKDIDLWGKQPGVQLDVNGRVRTLSIAGMGAKGVLPDAIGQLSELTILSLGSHSDKLGGHLFENVSASMSEEQKMDMRYSYERLVLERDFRCGLSEDWQKTIELDANSTPIVKKGISLKGIQYGDLTNGITGISKAVMRLVNLQQFYIANSPIKYEEFFRDIEPESPFYDKQDTLTWSNLNSLTDLEIYNCPNMTALPMDMLAGLPELQQLNVACCTGISGEQLKADWEALIKGASGSKLQILYLGFNNLVEFPEYDLLKKMEKLSLLDCTNNKIEKLHPFGKGVNFAKIYLDNNAITEIPTDDEGYFCGFTQMESFSCSNNKLTLFPDIFNANSIYVGQSINLSYNQISDFENGDNFKGVNVTQVDLSNNRFETFPSMLFKKKSPLVQLILAGNGMKEIPEGALKGENTYMLEVLDLSHNYLSKLPDDFYAVTLPYLTGIDLSYNRFKNFPTAPLSITSLQRFFIRHQRDADGNRCLREWPVGLYRCPSLAFFLIGSNDLRKIEDTLSPYIYYFEIADNPNISIDVTDLCPYIEAGILMFIYDKTQDIRGCSSLNIQN
ncbi:MAG: DUF4458 domain-containing protein [Bacteroidaceae bacterium]|nr:DUF4458 domain-containing protein [Bacteroidaceae bacterium]